jgi:hypothetical protein
MLPGKSELKRHQFSQVVKNIVLLHNELLVNCGRGGKAAIQEEMAVEGEPQQASDSCLHAVFSLPP